MEPCDDDDEPGMLPTFHTPLIRALTVFSEASEKEKNFPFGLLFSHLNINPCSCRSAVDCRIEEAPDRSIIVEGLQQRGDSPLSSASSPLPCKCKETCSPHKQRAKLERESIRHPFALCFSPPPLPPSHP
ncbi:hypothetical protein FQN60_006678, partial [Etheostoma spectabile]